MHHPAPRSGLARAGEILLLVGSILRVVTALVMVVYLVFMVWLSAALREQAGPGMPADAFGGFIWIIFLTMFVMLAASAVIGFVAWNKARAGQYRTSGILGIVASVLPPVDVIYLLGGIFVLVCDEAKAEEAAAQGSAEAAADAAWRHAP